MRTFTILAAVGCLCALQASAESGQAVAELEKFQTVLSENNRALRALQEIRSVQGHPTKRVAQYQRERDGLTAQAARQPSNIVYGKGRQAEQPKYTRQQFAPSQKPKQYTQHAHNKHKYSAPAVAQEDSGYETDVATQYAQGYKLNPQDTEVLQKYMQKYANQLYAAQKHSSQLSDSQKYVLGQDQYAKKHVVPQQQKYIAPQAPKFIPLQPQDAKDPPSTYLDESHEAPEPITADKYQNFQVQQKLVVQQAKSPKAPPKKAYSGYTVDSAPQYTSLYGNSLEPQLVNQYLSTYASQDKEAITGYEPHQSYGQYGAGPLDKAETPKITGYKIPGAVSLSLGQSHGQAPAVEEKGLHDYGHHEEHHYPSADPKYEYMYQVQDHEKHNYFGHSEARKGKTTWGRYYVQLPDGRFETVKYWADKSGYHAEVDFKGHAKHPSHKEHGHGSHSHGGGSSYSGSSNFKGYAKTDDGHEGYSTSEGDEF